MNFDFDDNDKALHHSIKDCFDENAKAFQAQMEKSDANEVRSRVLQTLSRLERTGYLDLGLDGEGTNVTLASTQEVLAGISPSLFLSVEMSARIFGRLIANYGAPEQKEEILPALKEGRIIGAVALLEDDGQTMDKGPQGAGVVECRDGYCVSGRKGPAVNGPIADWFAVAGETGGGVAFFLVRKGAKGLIVEQRLSTLGFCGSAISNISLESCPVDSTHVIGPFEGQEHMGNVRRWVDQTITAAGLGLMRRSITAALDYAKGHISRGKPLISRQEVGFKLAEMLTLLQTARLLAYRAAWMTDTKDREAMVLVHCAKAFCSESAQKVADYALQIMGGDGYLCGNTAEQSYRDSRYLEIAGASSALSRTEIADRLLEDV